MALTLKTKEESIRKVEDQLVDILRGLSRVDATTAVETVRRAFSRALPSAHKSSVAMALLRGLEAREALKNEEGGSLSTQETANLLGVSSKQAVIDRYHKGHLLAWTEKQGALRFPAWQFNDHGQVYPGLEQTLSILGRNHALDPWAKVLFFLNHRESLNGERPLDLLRRQQLEPLMDLAQSYIE